MKSMSSEPSLVRMTWSDLFYDSNNNHRNHIYSVVVKCRCRPSGAGCPCVMITNIIVTCLIATKTTARNGVLKSVSSVPCRSFFTVTLMLNCYHHRHNHHYLTALEMCGKVRLEMCCDVWSFAVLVSVIIIKDERIPTRTITTSINTSTFFVYRRKTNSNGGNRSSRKQTITNRPLGWWAGPWLTLGVDRRSCWLHSTCIK